MTRLSAGLAYKQEPRGSMSMRRLTIEPMDSSKVPLALGLRPCLEWQFQRSAWSLSVTSAARVDKQVNFSEG